MLSIDFIRQNKEKVAQAALNKNRKVDLERILMLDDQMKELFRKIQVLREERNNLAKLNDAEKSRERGKEIKTQLKKLEDELSKTQEELSKLMLYVPNVPLDEVPVGKDETSNVEIKKWGEQPNFSFTPKSHIELSESLDLVGFKTGSEVSGFRGYFLKNQLAQVHFALLFYVFQKLVAKGYVPVVAPSVVKEFTLFGSAHFPWGKAEDVYALNDKDSFLAGTEEILQELELPYRVLLMCTGDMGEPQMIKYDPEAWMPSRGRYGETMSNSIMGDFQCRRLNIRYKTREGGKTFCYSLNNTALASPRILIALLENHQQKDGSILLPKVLHDVVGFDTIVRI